MSAVIDLADSSLFGFAYDWGNQAFDGAIKVGTWNNGQDNANQGVFQQTYNYSTTTKDTWGHHHTHDNNGKVTYPDSRLSASSSSVEGGSQLSNVSVKNSDWKSSSSSTKQNAYYNLYSLFSQASQGDYELTANAPENYKSVPAPGGSYDKGNNRDLKYSYSSYSPGKFNIKNSIDLSNVQFTTNDSSLSIGTGALTASAQQLASGLNLQVQFEFIPGATAAFNFDNTFTNSVSSTNTTGVSTSSSSEQQASASFSISDTQTEKIGIDESNGTENSLTADFEAGWQGTWSNAKTANFTTTNAVSTTNSFEFTLTQNLNSAIQTGTSTTANGNQTPLYQYSTTYDDPSTGESTTTKFNLIAGENYVWNLYYYQGNVQNVVSGEYTVKGAAGNISDTSGNSFGGNIAQASYYANEADAWGMLGYGYNPIKSFYNSVGGDVTDVSQVASMLIDGSTTASTSLSTNLVLHLSQAESGSPSSPTSRKSSRRKNKISQIDLSGFLHQDPSESATTLHYDGSNKRDILTDTTGRDHIFSGKGADNITIQGNTSQDMHSGDHVDLGNGNDYLKVIASYGRNYFHAGSGDDVIIDSQADLHGTLGDGDDTYKYSGGNDSIQLGSGHDEIVIKKINNRSQLIVHDFLVATDKVTGIKRKHGTFSWDDTLNAFTHYNSKHNLNITLYTNDDPSSKATSSEFWLGLGLLNSDQLNITPQTPMEWHDIRTQYAKYAIDQSLTYHDWEDFSSNKKAIRQAFKTIALSYGLESVSSDELKGAIRLASLSDSYNSFIHASIDSLS